MGLVSGHLLTTGTEHDPLLPKLLLAINHASSIDICVSFAQPSGVELIYEALIDALESNSQVRVITSDYMYITHPRALRLLRLLKDHSAHVKLYKCTERNAFHLKSYIFTLEKTVEGGELIQAGTAFVGSSNLSKSALTSGFEWNLRFDLDTTSSTSLNEFMHIRKSFDDIYNSPQAVELTHTEISKYSERYNEITSQNQPLVVALGLEGDSEERHYTPNPPQLEALMALRDSRTAGHARGLVVMATGMGKTWLSAFDAQQIKAERVLFVAHREEILLQAQTTFSKIFPQSTLGFFNASSKEWDSELLFASIQTIGKTEYLQKFSPHNFDYIVVDEFHHATADSYQKLLRHFRPRFLLGLTATPERTDQSDILSLCDHNLVFEQNLVDGINQKILVPFHYHGFYDKSVDYREIPWRNNRFDPKAIEHSFKTLKRAKHIFGHWSKYRQTRTLGFCVSKSHADYMADYFTQNGVRAIAVYSGSTVRRNDAIRRLENRDIEVIFSVDFFNEGTDIPSVDTILMTRPTESKILFLQQLGRGLRTSAKTNKQFVVVLDFIGNHQSFLLKPSAILGTNSLREGALRLQKRELCLPESCTMNIDLKVIDFWNQLVEKMGQSVSEAYEELKISLGHRPTATEFYHAGAYKKTRINSDFGGWLGFVSRLENKKNLSELNKRHGEFFKFGIQNTAMNKCFKAILLTAFVELKGFSVDPGPKMRGVLLSDLAIHSWGILKRYPLAFKRDIPATNQNSGPESPEWQRYWKKNPVNAYTTANKSEENPWFRIEENKMIPNFQVRESERVDFESILLELCELRMAEYMARNELRP